MPNTVPHRLLIVDDDNSITTLLAESLTQLGGYSVTVASDGATGLANFFTDHPDCVIVDVRMPGLNGHQFVRALRGDGQTAQTPIVILSALIQEADQFAGMLSGADVYLLKPVKLADLFAAIEQAIRLTDEQRIQQENHLAFGEFATDILLEQK